jgi:hypothetical protein
MLAMQESANNVTLTVPHSKAKIVNVTLCAMHAG